jgi:lipid-A-disaccharide synthase
MTTLRIGIVAGEASGDILGSGLMRAIKDRHPDVQFEGIGGPLMLAEGFNSFFPMDRLSVMGLIEPLKRLFELLAIRRSIKQHFSAQPPDLFIGIDSPDFTLNIELALRQRGVLTAHYVSPSVWAWRQGRVKKIARAIDRMLTLLPFEAEFYHQHNVPVTFVGHPLADQYSNDADVLAQQQAQARATLSLASDDTVVAIMPGSRGGEVSMLGQAFIETAAWCSHQRANLKFVIPAASEARKLQLQQLLQEHGKGLPITLVDGQSKTVMLAADVVLMASGTTTLEALLLKKPMVVAYRLSRFTYFVMSFLMKARWFSLPNLLAGETLVPELLQDDVRPEMLGPLILERLQNPQQRQLLTERFSEIHASLQLGASERAAEVLLTMIGNHGKSTHTV